MRYTPILLLLFFITACGTGSSDQPADRTASGVTSVPVIMTSTSAPIPDSDPVVIREPAMQAQSIATCEGTPATRLVIQGRGRVSDSNNETLNLRNGPGTSFEILRALEPLDHFAVIGGPECAEGFTWFRVRYQNITGWIAEGDSEEYYAEPYLAG